MTQSNFTGESMSATFSRDKRYRYRLERTWKDGPAITFVMLNPSIADATKNDPTVERCVRRAKRDGYGTLRVVNLFALVSTDPNALRSHPDPIGSGNDVAILEASRDALTVVCAWGGMGNLNRRGAAVEAMLREEGIRLHALRFTQAGDPGHPLYVPLKQKLVVWERKTHDADLS